MLFFDILSAASYRSVISTLRYCSNDWLVLLLILELTSLQKYMFKFPVEVQIGWFPLVVNCFIGEVWNLFLASESWYSKTYKKSWLYWFLSLFKNLLLTNYKLVLFHQPKTWVLYRMIRLKSLYLWSLIVIPTVRMFEKALMLLFRFDKLIFLSYYWHDSSNQSLHRTLSVCGGRFN